MKRIFFLRLFIALILSGGLVSVKAQQSGTHTVTKNIEWAKPGGHSLTMDIYVPNTGKKSYPVLVVYHGGGWLINNNSIMDSLSSYIADHGEYIVCNVNYRLLPDQSNTVTMNQIVEDAMGALLWIKEHIKTYKGNPDKIAVTGDSAGGHLAAMVVFGGKMLESDGYTGPTLGFHPTYLPKETTAEQVATKNGLTVQAAIFSYAAFDIYEACKGNFESSSNFFWSFAQATPRGIFGKDINVTSNPEHYKKVSPVYIIPAASEQKLPAMLCTVGSKDNLITPTAVKSFIEKLNVKGHKAEYWEHEGRPHAFLDSKRNEFLGTEFRKDAIEALDKMIAFLDTVLK